MWNTWLMTEGTRMGEYLNASSDTISWSIKSTWPKCMFCSNVAKNDSLTNCQHACFQQSSREGKFFWDMQNLALFYPFLHIHMTFVICLNVRCSTLSNYKLLSYICCIGKERMEHQNMEWNSNFGGRTSVET
jgi:hypothetical protein